MTAAHISSLSQCKREERGFFPLGSLSSLLGEGGALGDPTIEKVEGACEEEELFP